PAVEFAPIMQTTNAAAAGIAGSHPGQGQGMGMSGPPTPGGRVASPRPERQQQVLNTSVGGIGGGGGGGGGNPGRRRKPKSAVSETAPGIPPGLLDNSVPPINVLIVEDNIINLK